ncbi:MFS transporter [Nocardioides sp.]|uniref:MFS transporter n=1 Tax=Nocardioides sp. TaxID=35761 RepID=UPI0035AECDC1
MIVALVAQVLVVIDISVVNTAMPTIGHDIGLASSDLQWVVTAYLLLSGGCLLLGGRVADLVSRRGVFLTGMALFTAASLYTGFADGAAELIGGRAAQGAAAALMTPAALAVISTTYTGAQRARGLALWGAIGGLGIAAGVALGGVLTTYASWQSIFWINVPIGLAALAAALHVLPADPKDRAGLAQFDVPGAVTGVGSLATLMLTLSRAEQQGWASTQTALGLTVAALLMAVFVVVEKRAGQPLVHPHTWRIRSLVSSTTVMLGVTGLLMAVVFLTSILGQTALGYSPLQSGLAFLPLAAALVVGTYLAAHGSAHLPTRALAAVGLAVIAGGSLVLSRVDAASTYAGGLLPGLCPVGLGAGLVFAAVAGTAMTGIPAGHTGMASGFLMTGHEVGAALGVAAVSAVAGTAGTFTSASGAVEAYARGSVAMTVIALLFGVAAAVWMPAGRADAAQMHLH